MAESRSYPQADLRSVAMPAVLADPERSVARLPADLRSVRAAPSLTAASTVVGQAIIPSFPRQVR
jgi:hypothetical protein